MIRAGPLTNGLEDGDDRAPLLGQPIFDTGRNFVELLSLDYIGGHQLFQRGGKHGVSDVGHFLSQGAVAQGSLFRQHADHAGFLFAAENGQSVL